MKMVRSGRVGLLAALVVLLHVVSSEILTPPYFNLAEGRKVYATATCGEDTEGPELYCKLVGATNAENDVNVNVIHGQQCDVCDPNHPTKRHPPEFAVDGMETWWQSPPLSRGMKYNEVNLTIDLGQEFHVAYVYVRMGNSPRPGLWILEKSVDYGKSFTPWQYFSDTKGDCVDYFGEESIQHITKDDSVICSTDHSRIVPLEGGEIPISLLNNRPSANHYFNSSVLQEWTRATNVRLRLLRTKNLLGHLMSVARQDPTVTRRYFYSIKDISIGGRCMCNGHADTCDNRDPTDNAILVCLCRHNTCGPKCDTCCPGFEQKAWRQSKSSAPFTCEPCNCFGHSGECKYDSEVDNNHTSLDIYNRYEGGGICQNCQHNTEGINCNRCQPKFYKPYTKHLNETDVCQPCNCDHFYSTGNCAEGSGRCECRDEFKKPSCTECSFGYYGYPHCKRCECNLNGTLDLQCQARNGLCDCKENFGGDHCKVCADNYYNFSECKACECNSLNSLSSVCDKATGECECSNSYSGRQCDQCDDGYYGYPSCPFCNCDVKGTKKGICDKASGKCICKEGYGGERCDQCIPGFYGYPECQPCNCSTKGSASTACDGTGKCPCLPNFAGRICDLCSPGHFNYPECLTCNCDSNGAIGITCNNDGICQCNHNFDGNQCNQCKEGFYNFPSCEDCNCHPAGVVAEFAGCGSVPAGELCQCKDRVQGRICDKCKPLYWNLNIQNPEGCEECNCHIPGVLGGISVCDTEHGQCTCKPSVVARGCTECDDGTFNLRADNLFGCTDCACDVGGSVSNVCDKLSGQCQCQPRVTGKTCKEPLQLHYFPTLYQYQYEIEDGHTQDAAVRYLYDEHEFPEYSWKGYAVFSVLQREVLQDIFIYKPSLYHMIFRYVNKNENTIVGTIKVIPENPNDIEQKYQVHFKNSSTPSFVTVMSGKAPVALVMNPGKWTISITVDKHLLLDYFVLLPEEFYLASVLNQKIEAPCKIGEKGLCREFNYPNVSRFDASLGAGGYIESNQNPSKYYTNNEHLQELKVNNRIPLLTMEQPVINYNITLSKSGRYVIVINYITPINIEQTNTIDVDVVNDNDIGYERNPDKIIFYNCPYTTLCRQVVTDQNGAVGVYNVDENYIVIKLKGEDANIGLQSVVAIPYEEWSLDYIQPRPICIRKDGKCISSSFPTPPESKKIQFETEAILEDGIHKEIISVTNTSSFIYLHPDDNNVDVRSKVPYPGFYTFIAHSYQPNFPEYNVDVLIQNGQFYEATLPVRHCPSISGCRALITQKDGSTKFSLTENFMITFKLPKEKNLYLDYLLVVPSDLYTQRILAEDDLDRTGEFITNCGMNHFDIDTSSSEDGFCKDSVFSITAGYNNGALQCDCDFDGSLSFECDKFGGQCQCRPNVIGRTCTICKPGFYGFPNCKACNCPTSSTCHSISGQCICPQNVIGELCDQCKPLTYGFEPFSGCEDCKCDILGVNQTLQCDLENGNCPCKGNIIGRKCDSCIAGNYAFPHCDTCECELRGTTEDICDQLTAECFCKKFVTGPACDICRESTYNLQEKNEDGCNECFCFGKTSRCSSSNLVRTHIFEMGNWSMVQINDSETLQITELNLKMHRVGDNSLGADFGAQNLQNTTIYFSAPEAYLGKRLTSYGAYIKYTLFYTLGNSGKATLRPDVILQGGNGAYLVYNGYEQPAPAQDFVSMLELVEMNFVLPTGVPAKREHIMVVLEDLRGIYIRATYWSETLTSRLTNVLLDDALSFSYYSGDIDNYELAVSVESCLCPPNYQGLSCEECAKGYYRISTGPHGGHCAPCLCNGHAEECDLSTGVCLGCQHNTIGDHCDQCAVGYHGNAQQGTPRDCLICACPLPIGSNNFAKSCDVSGDGNRISCDCNDGYIGARCQGCAPGFFGRPDSQGDFCKPCQCSGNIDTNEPNSCDSHNGECLRCMNNTFGDACALCAPGFYGDAITIKDCQTCVCDSSGTDRCNSYTGDCVCKMNVIGDKCDRCEVDHYGFQTGSGCTPCECGEGAVSGQCDDVTGQCRCKPGVTGRTCDKCAPGYWNYTAEGCVSCGCKSEYSLGFGCNAQTGQCECLQGVTGEKCDRCPYRWTFIPDYGCFGCDTCTHDLLDSSDELSAIIDPIQSEFDSVGSGYFTTRRLAHINDTIRQLRPKVALLSPDQINLQPITKELESMEQDSKNMYRKANYSLDNSKTLVKGTDELRDKSFETLKNAEIARDDAKFTIEDIAKLAENLGEGQGPRLNQALQNAEDMLALMKIYNLTNREDSANEALDQVMDLLDELKTFKQPVDLVTDEIGSLKKELVDFNFKLDDLSKQTQYSLAKTSEAEKLYDANGKERLEKKLANIKLQTEEQEKNLLDSNDIIKNATKLLNDAIVNFDAVAVATNEFDSRNNKLNTTLEENFNKLSKIEDNLPDIQDHAASLSRRAEELDNLLRDTREIADNAVKAATAYADIDKAIDDAENAAQNSNAEVQATAEILGKIEEETYISSSNSSELLEDAHEARKSIDEIEPKLNAAKAMMRPIRSVHQENEEQLKNIEKFIASYHSKSLEDSLIKAKENAEEADTNTEKTMEGVGDFKEVANHTESAKALPKKVYDANRDMEQVRKQIEQVGEKLPKIIDSIKNVPSEHEEAKALTVDLEAQIKKLNQQIALARDIANRIDVGVKFNPSTTLELKNPDNLEDMSTSTQISGFFRTDQRNGLIMYLGNGNGTNLRRTKTDDYMALVIENGYPVLSLDLGNGPERVINEKYVADNTWYQFVIDRTGLNAKLTIKDQLTPGGEVREYPKEHQLDGPYSIFNLDKNQSKLFVGSYPSEFNMQEVVHQNAFEGEIEGLVVGETPISLWNFNSGYNNNQGANHRNRLIDIRSSGYRFNGNGYAIMNARTHNFRRTSEIKLSFKTFATEGLLFLHGKGKTFVSLEMRNGKVLYKYNLGYETKVHHTKRAYNDGLWHTVTAARDGAVGRLTVDNVDMPTTAEEVRGVNLEPAETIFFGGYPAGHQYNDVTKIDFDGCIDNVTITGTPVDLSQNIKAYGVTPGCPVKYTRLVSFSAKTPGFIKKENISANNDAIINLKFKTKAKDGLIFYFADRAQQSGISLALKDGYLQLISQKTELKSKENTFNDDEWHVVSVRHLDNVLRLDFDDYGYVVSDEQPPQIQVIYGDIYIGGLPSNYKAKKGMIDHYVPFSGCIGDATFNGSIINFASSTTKYGDILGKCILDAEIGSDSDVHTVPILPALPEIGSYTTIEPEEQTVNVYESAIPARGDGGVDGGNVDEDLDEITEETDTDTEEAIFIGEVDADVEEETSTWPTPRPHPSTTTSTAPTCALPLDPAIDENYVLSNSFRYGTEKDSRIEYKNSRGKYRKKFDFKLEFKTTHKNGILFYVDDTTKHSHFVALFMKDGHLNYMFNGGGGNAELQSYIMSNDDIWHEVIFSRDGQDGKLVIDDSTVAEGRASGNSNKLEIVPPYYIGGVNPSNYNHVLGNLNITDPFNGCIRNVIMNDKVMDNPDKYGVIPCSEHVEAGTFFGSKGGLVKLRPKFRVGTEIDIKMEIKPRNLTGLIMAVHGRHDYFVLELDNGAIKLIVNNGKGPIITRFQPSNPHYLCDGQWHSIQAVKSKSVVTLSVDRIFSDPGIGDHRSASTDTGGYLFLGGHRNILKAKGLNVRVPYVGCIKNVIIGVNNNIEVETITPDMVEGHVTIGSCPTN